MQRKIVWILACVLPLVAGTCGGYTIAVEGKEQRQGVPPLALVLLLDKSSTAPRYMPFARQAVTELLRTMNGGDAIALCEFQQDSLCLTRFTANPNEILDPLENINGIASSSGNYSDALVTAIDYLETAAPGSKRAVVIVSNDGERFQPSQHSQEELVKLARNSGIQIHFIQIGTYYGMSTGHGADSAATRKEHLCSETGGKSHEFGFSQVESETDHLINMRNQELAEVGQILDTIRRQPAPARVEGDAGTSTSETAEAPGPALPTPASSDEMWKVIGWLPSHTETVMIGRAAFNVPDLSREEDDAAREPKALRDQTPQKDLEEYVETEVLNFLGHMNSEKQKQLAGQTAVLAVKGFRHPRDSPTGEGFMSSEGCLILMLEKDWIERDDLSESAGQDPKLKREIIAGRSVVVGESDGEPVFMVHASPRLVFIATDRDYLQEVLARMAGRSGQRALPANLPEWRHVNSNARFWAVRHFDRFKADKDPSSPFNAEENDEQRDEQAVGVTFSFDFGGPAVVTYFTGGRGFLATIQQSRQKLEPEFRDLDLVSRELEPGVFQFSWNLTDDYSVETFLLHLDWLLGQGIEGL